MLTGEALLAKVKEMRKADRDAVAEACGYSFNGRLRMSAFYQALIDANGVKLLQGEPKRRGRPASYRGRVLHNGQAAVGASYTRELGAKAGDKVTISVRGGSLVLRIVVDDQ